MIDDATLRELGYGWFTNDSNVPAFDPGNVPCLVCGKPWDKATVSTTSFMGMERGRSYFYRIHRACETPETTMEIESRIIDDGMPGH